MPSHPLSGCPSVRNQYFFKLNRLLQFSSYLSDIWLECVQRYCAKTCAIEILIVSLWFLNGSLTKYKIWVEIWNFGVFWPFPQKSFIWDHETCFTGMLWVLSCVCVCACVKWPKWAEFSGPYGGKTGKYIDFRHFLEKFPLDLLDLHARWSYFCWCEKFLGNMCDWPKILVCAAWVLGHR